MDTTFATWEWHLTRAGWVPGLQTPPPDRAVRCRVPSSRLATYVFSRTSGSDAPQHGWTQTWAVADADAINASMRRFGALPEPVSDLVLAAGNGDGAVPRVRCARAPQPTDCLAR